MQDYLSLPSIHEQDIRTVRTDFIDQRDDWGFSGDTEFKTPKDFDSIEITRIENVNSKPAIGAITTLAYSSWSNRLPRRNRRSVAGLRATEFLTSDFVDTSLPPDVSNKLSYCQFELSAWKTQLTDQHFNAIKLRLMALIDDVDAMSTHADMNSFGVLLAYLSKHPEFKTPTISYRTNGVFFAIWDSGAKSRLTVDFLDDSNIRWVYVDSSKGINKVKTGAGIDNLTMLPKVLEVYDIGKWVRF